MFCCSPAVVLLLAVLGMEEPQLSPEPDEGIEVALDPPYAAVRLVQHASFLKLCGSDVLASKMSLKAARSTINAAKLFRNRKASGVQVLSNAAIDSTIAHQAANQRVVTDAARSSTGRRRRKRSAAGELAAFGGFALSPSGGLSTFFTDLVHGSDSVLIQRMQAVLDRVKELRVARIKEGYQGFPFPLPVDGEEGQQLPAFPAAAAPFAAAATSAGAAPDAPAVAPYTVYDISTSRKLKKVAADIFKEGVKKDMDFLKKPEGHTMRQDFGLTKRPTLHKNRDECGPGYVCSKCTGVRGALGWPDGLCLMPVSYMDVDELDKFTRAMYHKSFRHSNARFVTGRDTDFGKLFDNVAVPTPPAGIMSIGDAIRQSQSVTIA